jgi:argonaute-like protein implicated in RNA metabolism and viral defense
MSKQSTMAGAAQHRCDGCGQTFNSKGELQEHQRIMHPAQDGRCRCDVCGQVFNSDNELGEHKRVMHPEKERAR